LILSKTAKKQKWVFLEYEELAGFEGSCNQIIISERDDLKKKKQRLEFIIKHKSTMLLKNLDINNYPEEIDVVFLSSKMGLFFVKEYVILKILLEFLELNFSEAMNYFPDNFIDTMLNNYNQILKIVDEKTYLSCDQLYKNYIFSQIKFDDVFIHEKYNFMLKIINQIIVNQDHGEEDESLPKHFSSIFNPKNPIDSNVMMIFLSMYHDTVSEGKLEWNKEFELLKELDSTKHDTKVRVFNHLKEIKFYNLKFFFLEMFEKEGFTLEQKTNGFVNFFAYGFNKTNNCSLSEENVQHFVQMAIDNEWLKPSLLYSQNHLEIYRRCHLITDGENQYYSILVNPTNTKRCEFVVKKFTDENGVIQEVILSDTVQYYWYGISCLRHTRSLERNFRIVLARSSTSFSDSVEEALTAEEMEVREMYMDSDFENNRVLI
jgi:hypothetical protein